MHIYRTDQAPTSDLVDTNDNKQQADLKCDNEQYADCDNKTSPAISELQLQDLSWVGTLGIGGFGRVELVTAGENNNLTFALKKMKKIEVRKIYTYLYDIVQLKCRYIGKVKNLNINYFFYPLNT